MLLPHRGRRGYGVYAQGMEASARIANLGCGNDLVLELLRRKERTEIIRLQAGDL